MSRTALSMAMALALAGAAHADPPDKVAASYPLAFSEVSALAVSDDGRLVAAADGSVAYLLDTDTWEVETLSDCAAYSVAFVDAGVDAWDVWLGCSDGSLAVHSWADDGATASGADRTVAMGSGPVHGLWLDDVSGSLYALEEGSDGVLQVHSVDPDADTVDAAVGYPVGLAYDGFVDAVVSGGALYVAHGSDDMSRLVFGASAAVINVTQLAVSLDDIAASPAGGVYGADDGGYVVEYSSVGQWLTLYTTLDNPTSVTSFVDDGVEHLLVPQESVVDVFDVSGTFVDPDPVSSFALPDDVGYLTDLVDGDGWMYAGTDSGEIVVLTANPWVSGVTVTPSTAIAGEVVTIGFDVDVGGSWSVNEGGDRSGSGTTLVSGNLSAPGRVETEFTVGDSWAEGDTALYIVVTDNLLRTGHAKTTVLVDNPPDLPPLDQDSLGFGDEALILDFDGVTDEDLSSYVVYVSQTAFSASEWATGGPEFDGPDRLEAPITVSAEGGQAVSVYIGPLTNYVTYYVAVRAYDSGGLEGPMSKVVSGTPRPTFAASELAEEDGSLACGPAGGVSSWLLVAMALGAISARRRRGGAAVAALLGVCALAPGVAHAEPTDLTPAWGNFEVRYGSMTFDDANIQKVYGTSGRPMVLVEFGPQLWRFFELDFGVGFSQTVGNTVDDAGLSSAEISNFTVLPLSGSLTGRLHVLDEQILVPYISYGLDYVVWRESWDAGYQVKDQVSGAKRGTHRSLGIDLMLDVFAPGRASLLEAQTGINDSYIVFEWRKSEIDPEGGLSLSSDAFMVGLKLDY